MNFYFIVEDSFGPQFIQIFFRKKADMGLVAGNLIKARTVNLGHKLSRATKIATGIADRVIILRDADGEPLERKDERIRQFLDLGYVDRVRIVSFDHEIEELICYLMQIPIKGRKPSDVLKQKIPSYRKNRLPRYAEKLDCERLKDCNSFKRLLSAPEP